MRHKSLDSWFRPEDYEPAEHFGASDWYLSLMLRSHVEQELGNHDLEDVDGYWEKYVYRSRPGNIHDLYKEPDLVATLDIVRAFEEIAGFPKPPIAQLIDGKIVIPVREEIAKQAEDNGIWLCKRILLVDMMATDDDIRTDFEEWLKGARAVFKSTVSIRGPRRTNTTLLGKHFSRWADHQILARMDLTLWAKAFGFKQISDEKFGNLMLGTDREIHTKDWGKRCRKQITEASNLLVELQFQAKQDERLRALILGV